MSVAADASTTGGLGNNALGINVGNTAPFLYNLHPDASVYAPQGYHKVTNTHEEWLDISPAEVGDPLPGGKSKFELSNEYDLAGDGVLCWSVDFTFPTSAGLAASQANNIVGYDGTAAPAADASDSMTAGTGSVAAGITGGAYRMIDEIEIRYGTTLIQRLSGDELWILDQANYDTLDQVALNNCTGFSDTLLGVDGFTIFKASDTAGTQTVGFCLQLFYPWRERQGNYFPRISMARDLSVQVRWAARAEWAVVGLIPDVLISGDAPDLTTQVVSQAERESLKAAASITVAYQDGLRTVPDGAAPPPTQPAIGALINRQGVNGTDLVDVYVGAAANQIQIAITNVKLRQHTMHLTKAEKQMVVSRVNASDAGHTFLYMEFETDQGTYNAGAVAATQDIRLNNLNAPTAHLQVIVRADSDLNRSHFSVPFRLRPIDAYSLRANNAALYPELDHQFALNYVRPKTQKNPQPLSVYPVCFSHVPHDFNHATGDIDFANLSNPTLRIRYTGDHQIDLANATQVGDAVETGALTVDIFAYTRNWLTFNVGNVTKVYQ